MSALQALIRPARAEANRRNARKSTGPRTEAGKARSRGNALKHGLAGEGLALPVEDEAAVAGRFDALREQLRPATPLGSYYVRRIALAMVRTDRAARHEAAALSLRVRHAVADFDRSRLAEVDDALARLRLGSGRAARRDLLGTVEGIDRLLDELAGLRRCLDLPEPLWSREHGARLDACLGVDPDPIIPSRVEALSVAALGMSRDLLTRRDLAAVAEAGVDESAYAFGQIAALIEREADALRLDRAGIDPADAEADRLGAADRALFDPSPAAQLARRYEAAARRELDRSLRLLRESEAAATDGPDKGPPSDGEDPPAPLDTPANAAGPIDCFEGDAVKSNFGNGLGLGLASFGRDCLVRVDRRPTAVDDPVGRACPAAATPPARRDKPALRDRQREVIPDETVRFGRERSAESADRGAAAIGPDPAVSPRG